MEPDLSFERKLGIVLSRPIAYLFFLIYLIQSSVLVYFVYEYYDNQELIAFQQKRISELEERLQILDIIQDFQVGFNDKEVGQLANTIYDESKKYGYDPRLLMAVILTESSFRKGQTSQVGAKGLMQIKVRTGADVASRRGLNWKGDKALFNPAFNVKVGSLYLFELILKFRDVKKALIAYNLGETELRHRLITGQKIPSQYLKKVLVRYRELLKKYPDV